MVVDLPAPFGPRKPVTIPGRTVKSSRSTAILSPYLLLRPCAWIIGNLQRQSPRRPYGVWPPGGSSAELIFPRPAYDPGMTLNAPQRVTVSRVRHVSPAPP